MLLVISGWLIVSAFGQTNDGAAALCGLWNDVGQLAVHRFMMQLSFYHHRHDDQSDDDERHNRQ